MKKLTGEQQNRIFFWISALGLLVTFALLLVMSFYNTMSEDDYIYVRSSLHLWREHHSMTEVMANQFQWAYGNYFSNQGTFATEWLVSSFLVMTCENHYYLGSILILITMIAGEGILLMLIGVKALGADRYTAGIVTCWCILLQLAMAPYPVEAFYWLTGALMYTLWYALCVFLFIFFFLFLYRDEKAKEKDTVVRILLQVGILLLSILIGFGNYVTAIFLLTSYLVLLCWIFVGEKLIRGIHRRKKTLIEVVADFVVFFITFMFNVLAPGNQDRMAYATEDISAVKAILKSVFAAAESIVVSIHFPIIVIMILMIPFMVRMVEARKFRFPLPVLVSVITFGLYACQFVPNMYVLQFLGAGRVQNLYRFTFYLWLFVNELYWIGFILRGLREAQDAPIRLMGWKKSYLLPLCAMEIALMCFGFYFYGGKTITPVSAMDALVSGQAAQYRAEQEARLEILTDPSVEDAYIDQYSNPPYLLFFGDIKKDPSAWQNLYTAEFYGKKSVHSTQEEGYEK